MIEETLESLAEVEGKIGLVVSSLKGTMEQKAEYLKSAGIYRKYAQIFAQYLLLAAAPKPGIEALKRAVFLAWYEVAEPACFTGIADLPSDSRLAVVGLVEPVVTDLDDEFRWMLAWYYLIADFAFPALDTSSKSPTSFRY